MSQRTVLIAAAALMAAGLLLGGVGVILGSATEVPSPEPGGPGWQQGPQGGYRPVRPGFGPGAERGPWTWQRIPGPAPSPATSPSPNP